MGSIEFRSGDLDRARSFLEEFVRIRKQNKEQPKDGHFVNVLFMIGNIHKIQGNHKVAKNSWSEAQDILQALGLWPVRTLRLRVGRTSGLKEALREEK
jgi:hypothetical protein